MMKFILKLTFITLLCAAPFLVKAQIGYDYAQYDVGFAAGLNQATATDVQSLKTTPSVHLNLNYNQTPFVNYVFELQVGRLKGGDSTNVKTRQREFENHFIAYTFRAQVQAGEIIDYSQSNFANALKNLYLSTGLGYIHNNIVARSKDVPLEAIGVMLPGDRHTNEVFIPARIGYEIKFFNSYDQPSFKLDIGYQYNFVLGDELDGYIAGKHKDTYSQFTVGFKFAIGGVTSYRKQISY